MDRGGAVVNNEVLNDEVCTRCPPILPLAALAVPAPDPGFAFEEPPFSAASKQGCVPRLGFSDGRLRFGGGDIVSIPSQHPAVSVGCGGGDALRVTLTLIIRRL